MALKTEGIQCLAGALSGGNPLKYQRGTPSRKVTKAPHLLCDTGFHARRLSLLEEPRQRSATLSALVSPPASEGVLLLLNPEAQEIPVAGDAQTCSSFSQSSGSQKFQAQGELPSLGKDPGR